ncbi:MAG: isocitrate/isopropylmalate dehydrogenase family protein [Synergistales bacterium]|nr:isocitrate/isopropylmalate dehydrogenase family protein [Synergistales bacterium]
MNRHYNIACIPGDGIGEEVIAQTTRVLEAATSAEGASLEWREYPFGGAHYLKTGEVFPDSAQEEIKDCDALLLGAIGHPGVKPGILERGILLNLRFAFDQYVNLRPARSYPRIPLPVRLDEGEQIDTVVVRENTEDFYIGVGERSDNGRVRFDIDTRRSLYTASGHLDVDFGNGDAAAVQLGFATEQAIRRVTRFACNLAGERGEKEITLASKANALPQIYGFWDEVAADEAAKQGITLHMANVDALCYHLVRAPSRYSVILTPNMFGDIVSDLLAGISGGLGVAAGGNIGDGLSMFEPVHGSAPDIAGLDRANPLAAILSGRLLLEHLGESASARRVERAVERYLATAPTARLPMEFGGEAGTTQVGGTIAGYAAE